MSVRGARVLMCMPACIHLHWQRGQMTRWGGVSVRGTSVHMCMRACIYLHWQRGQITRWGGGSVRGTGVLMCMRASIYLYINVQCRIVWKQPSCLSREGQLGAASMPIICPQEKD